MLAESALMRGGRAGPKGRTYTLDFKSQQQKGPRRRTKKIKAAGFAGGSVRPMMTSAASTHELTKMDSGVETGNESNDSCATQHDNLVGLTSAVTSDQTQTSGSNAAEPASALNGISMPNTSTDLVVLSDAISHRSSPAAPQDIRNAQSISLLNVGFDSKPFLEKILEFRMYNKDCAFKFNPLPSPVDNQSKEPWINTYRARMKFLRNRYDCDPVRREVVGYMGGLKTLIDERKMRLAAVTNNIDMMQRLLDAGVSPNNCDGQGRSPLHLASCRGYTDMVSLLLQHGADPNRRDCVGNTPLHLAAVTSKISVVTRLLMAGTDVLSSDCHGHNPLQLAQTKLRVLQNCKGSDMNSIKEEVHSVIAMLLAYLQKQKDAREQVEALSSFCSRLSLSNTSDEIQSDVSSLLASIDSLSLSN